MQRNPPGSGCSGRTLPVQAKGLAKIGEVGEARRSPHMRFPGPGRICRPAFRGGFLLYGFWCRGPRVNRDQRTGHSAHSASLHQYPAQSNRAGYPLVRKAILHLDEIAGSMAFSESEQSKNEAGGMVPLYAARVQDLGPDDVAVFKCGACGHTAEPCRPLAHDGLGLQPTERFGRNGGCDAGCATQGEGRGVDQVEGDEYLQGPPRPM